MQIVREEITLRVTRVSSPFRSRFVRRNANGQERDGLERDEARRGRANGAPPHTMLHTRERIDRLYERRLDTSDTALQRTPRRIIHPADMVMDVLSGAQLSAPLTRSLIVMRLCAAKWCGGARA